MEKRDMIPMKHLTALVLGAVAFYWGLNHLALLGSVAGKLLGFAAPFLLGCALAFLLNIPLRFVERHLGRLGMKGKTLRGLAIVVTLVLVVGIITGAVFVVVPQIGETINSIRLQLPGFWRKCEALAAQVSGAWPEISRVLEQTGLELSSITKGISTWLSSLGRDVLSSSLSIATSVFSGVVTFFVAFIFALYLLAGKETLSGQCVRVMRAYLPRRVTEEALRVCRLINTTFTGFFTGQCLEACILGLMFFVAMSLFRFPYAVLVAVTVGFTALIPVFGAFIGCAVGAFLILVENPVQALWFVVLFLVLQQVEGNLIYPRVVGSSVGLPPIWVLVAVTLGGSTFGVAGMLLFIPTVSVLYTLLRENVRRRLSGGGGKKAEKQA